MCDVVLVRGLGDVLKSVVFVKQKTAYEMLRSLVGSEMCIRDRLKGHCRPEFLNRVDEIVVFRSLGEKEIARIVDIQLRLLEARIEERKLTLLVTDAARAGIARAGYDPDYGARPLKRAIQRFIQDPLALAMLEGRFHEGDTVEVDADANGAFAFRKKG